MIIAPPGPELGIVEVQCVSAMSGARLETVWLERQSGFLVGIERSFQGLFDSRDVSARIVAQRVEGDVVILDLELEAYEEA